MSKQPLGNHGQRMASTASIRLLEVEPDLARFLSQEEKAELRALSVPERVVGKGPLNVEALLRSSHAFGAIVLEGMLLDRLRVGDQPSLRLIGPGDFLWLPGQPRSTLVATTDFRAAATTRLAMLGREVLLAASRWPRTVGGLLVRTGEQSERMATQLAICQLPQVGQRLLALFWLLAESWGRVTPIGTSLPLAVTHDALGEMVGAKRSTVTLALGELVEAGAIVRQDGGWLLIERPEAPQGAVPKLDEPELLVREPSAWAGGSPASSGPLHHELVETVVRLREEHRLNVARVEARLTAMRTARAGTEEVRRRVSEQALSRRRVPSS
jgi:CRP-like cAMP-binding protein